MFPLSNVGLCRPVGAAQAKPQSPPVYRPAGAAQGKLQGPPVYRPAGVAQAKPPRPPVYRPAGTAQAKRSGPPVYRPAGTAQAKPLGPPVYRPTGTAQAKPQGPPVYQPAGTAKAHIGGAIQRRVWINTSQAYNRDERITSFDYARDGSAGGKHFVPDLAIKNTIGELLLTRTRADGMGLLQRLWVGTRFTGRLDIPEFASTDQYDDTVNKVINAISNQASNRFYGPSSGDDGGQALDVPERASNLRKVSGYAQKLHGGLTAVEASLGPTGRRVVAALAEYVPAVEPAVAAPVAEPAAKRAKKAAAAEVEAADA